MDFVRALLTLNAPGSPGAAAALFARFDTHGAGRIDAARFSSVVLGIVPTADSSALLRDAKTVACEAITRRGGPHALRFLHRSLIEASQNQDRVPLHVARAVVTAAVGAEARGHAETILRECSSVYDFECVSAKTLCDMLRVPLTRRARAALDSAWAKVGGAAGAGARLRVSALAAAPRQALSLAGGLISRDFAESWGAPVSASADFVSYTEWLDYGRDVGAAAGSDEAFAGVMAAAWGIAPAWDARSAKAMPGSPLATFRARLDAGDMTDAAAATSRRGGNTGPASEASGVPVCLGQPLGRHFAPSAYEPMFGVGSAVAVPSGTLLAGGGSNVWPAQRLAGTTFLAGATLGGSSSATAHGAGDSMSASSVSRGGHLAETYARVRHTKTQSGYLQGNYTKGR